MAIAIHHGPNGSYKSSGVIQDFLLPAMFSGRVVVTNVRGVSRENCFELYPEETSADFDVIYVDTDSHAGREKIARWFHWAPLGALLLFDEAGVMFPKRWRDSDINKLNYPEGEEQGRPTNWIDAWHMHRHYNWDIVLMCPNIKAVRDDIRQTSEAGYKHKNRALLLSFLKGSYNLGMHSAENNGASPSDYLWVKPRKIQDDRIFKLYQSTKTGQHQDTINASSILKNGRLSMALGVATVALCYSAYSFIFGDAFNYTTEVLDSEGHKIIDSSVPVASQGVDSSFRRVSDNGLDNKQSTKTNNLEPFGGYEFQITGYISNPDRFLYFFDAVDSSGVFPITSTELNQAGYTILRITDCSATIVYKHIRQTANCKPIKQLPARGA